MLQQRVITAAVLLALLLPALLAASAWPFSVLTLALIAAAAWEWSRLNGVTPVAAFGPAVLLGLAGLWAVWVGSTTLLPAWAWWAATAAWVVLAALALRGGPAAWARWPAVLRLGGGLLALWVGWLAIAGARARGINFLLSAMCLVWIADIAAYAAGRAFGRRKLAPAISPGKTWEGVAGAVLGVWLLALLWPLGFEKVATVDGASLFDHLRARVGWLGTIAVVTAMAGLSVVGDLFESLVKRAAGVKDSSRLLPGHGGVLDRIDALLPVLPAALALASL